MALSANPISSLIALANQKASSKYRLEMSSQLKIEHPAFKSNKRFLSKPCDCRNSCNRETGLSPILSSSETYEDFGILNRFSTRFQLPKFTNDFGKPKRMANQPSMKTQLTFPNNFFASINRSIFSAAMCFALVFF